MSDKRISLRVLRDHRGLLLTMLVYLVLVIPMVPQHGTSYDEETDSSIAEHYISDETGWLRGTATDAINVRLPMYITALVTAVYSDGTICVSRYVSCLFGLLTMLAVYRFCERELTRRVGVTACCLIALSPYYLAFSKVAMTEGDIFVTCFSAWLLVCVAALRRRPNLGWTTTTGVCLGLALSAKVSAVALVPATAIALWLPGRGEIPPQERRFAGYPLLLLLGLPLAAAAVVSGWVYAGADSLDTLAQAYAEQSDQSLALHYGAVLVVWAGMILAGFLGRGTPVAWPLQVILVCGLAATTFFAMPPVHTTNPAVATAIINQFLDSNATFDWGYAWEALVFHTLVILLKPSVVIGLGLWLSVLIAVAQWHSKPQLRVPLVVFGCYFAFLVLKMTWSQTYYMMVLLPIMSILLADQLVDLYARRKSAALAAGSIGAAMLATDLVRSYPDTHLNGYQWVGERYLAGRSTVGYRGIVQTPSDGVEQVARWAMENVPLGDRLVYYTHARHLLFRVFGQPLFVANDGLFGQVRIDEANYVLITINATVDHGWGTDDPDGSIFKYPFHREKLERDFRRIYVVRRRFDLVVAEVWFRKKPYRVTFEAAITGFESEESGLRRHPFTY